MRHCHRVGFQRYQKRIRNDVHGLSVETRLISDMR